jgi:hypothetical protein
MLALNTNLKRLFIFLSCCLAFTASNIAAFQTNVEAAQIKTPSFQAPAQTDIEPAAAGDERWSTIFSMAGVEGQVDNIAQDGLGNIYVSGQFTNAGNTKANRIAKWDGKMWHALGEGLGTDPSQIAADANGVYAVDTFLKKAGDMDVNGLARWDNATKSWKALGNGTGATIASQYGEDEGEVNSVAAANGKIYVGGKFTHIDGVAANSIAVWDGTKWSALGGGIMNYDEYENKLIPEGEVNRIQILDNKVYVAGSFQRAGGVQAYSLAVWDGNAWSSLGDIESGDFFPQGYVGALVVRKNGANTQVYVGGKFKKAGGLAVNHIAMWENGWKALGSGVPDPNEAYWGPVRSLAHDGTHLYVGGDFNSAGGVASKDLARWDGTQWSTTTDKAFNEDFDAVYSLLNTPAGVYVGGHFRLAGGLRVDNIALFKGNQWTPLGFGTAQNAYGRNPGEMNSISVDAANNVYVAGQFEVAGGLITKNIAMWNGSKWSALETGVNGRVQATVAVGTDIYVAGEFTQAGSVSARNIAKWNGATKKWSSLGNGINGTVYALAYSDGILYAGGDFTAAGDTAAFDLAWWDGAKWHAFGTKNRIYEIGDQGGEVGTLVYALAVEGTTVIAGGHFQTMHIMGTNPQDINNYHLVNNVVGWYGDIDEWFTLGVRSVEQEPGVTTDTYSGFGTDVKALAIIGADVYVGGDFNLAGTTAVEGIARWNANSNSWFGLNAGVGGAEEPSVYALAAKGNTLFVGGQFTSAGDTNARFIAKYDGINKRWSTLGSGISYYNDRYTNVKALDVSTDTIYAAGSFDQAGGFGSSGFAAWGGTTATARITPANGGQVADADGTKVNFPAGAVEKDTRINYTPQFGSNKPAPNGYKMVRSFRLEGVDGTGAKVSKFGKNYTLTVPYSDAQLRAAGVTDPTKLNVAYWDGQKWVAILPCTGCKVDTAAKTVTVVLDHFTEFALIGEASSYNVYLPSVKK